MDIELKPDALTQTDVARLYVKRNANVTVHDDLLNQAINAYSKAIARYTSREFLPATNTLEREYGYDGDGQLSLSPYEARAVTSITVQAVGTTVAAYPLVDGLDYVLRPTGGTTEDTYLDVHFTTAYGGVWIPTARWVDPTNQNGFIVAVTGDWGAGTVPDDVAQACLIAVASNFRNPEGMASRAVGELTFSGIIDDPAEPGQSLPRASRALLKPFRRPRPLVRSVRTRSETHFRRILPLP